MNEYKKTLNVFGASSCWGAQDHDCEGGPQALYALGLMHQLNERAYDCQIHHLSAPLTTDDDPEKMARIAEYCAELGAGVRRSVEVNEKFVVVGGDHSCAIGTWSGVSAALAIQGDIGLIWIDAHMDSHTLSTSHSGAIHGMPLAALLGIGDPQLTNVLGMSAKLRPQNVCLLGVRSFEEEEKALLGRLGVRVYSQDEIKVRGLAEVLNEARARVRERTVAYGISIDLDAVDPSDAPGVGSPEPNGLSGIALTKELGRYKGDDRLVGIEIVELNPVKDKLGQTSALALNLLLAVL